MVNILDGKLVASKVKEKIKNEINNINNDIKPCLMVIRVETRDEESDFANKKYIRNKEKACEFVGMVSVSLTLSYDTTEDELIDRIKFYNNNENVHGIMVQQPLPKHINPNVVNENIDPIKDVDGFHPVNLGLCMLNREGNLPCTPYGIMEIFKHYDIELKGKNAVVVGRSNIVGKPLTNLLINSGATVTCCNSNTKNLEDITKRADIVITAIGKANYFDSSYFKDGQTIIDVGINFNNEKKMCGDVNFKDVTETFNNINITPVPGGVGQMTVAMLLTNTLNSYKKMVK